MATLTFVDGTKLLTQIIRPKLVESVEDPKPTFVTEFPADLADVVPLIVGKAVAGSELDPRFGADFLSCQFDVYANGRTAAVQWSNWLRGELYDAYDKQTVFGEGHISSFSTTMVPYDFPDTTLPDGVVRFLSEYRLGVKPP